MTFPTRTLGIPTARRGLGWETLLGLGITATATTAGLVAASRPSQALTAFIALVVVGVCLLRIDVAILLVVATGPLEAAVTRTFAGLSVSKATGALCFASFAFNVLRTGRPIRFDRSHLAVLLILAFAMVSTLQARDQAAAATTTIRYASFAAVFIVLTQFAGDRAVQRKIAWVLSLAASVAAIIGLQSYFANKYYAATINYTNANDFAFALATTLPLTFWLLGGPRVLRPVVVAMIAVISAATVLSLSRGTLLGVGAGMLFVLLTDRRRFRLVLGGGLIAIVATVLVIRSNPATFQTAIFGKQKVASTNVTTRFDAWRAAVDLASTHPLLGIGPGNFQAYFYEATARPPGTTNLKVVHDAYLDIAAELGVVAALAFLVYIGVALSRLSTIHREDRGPPGFAQAVRVALVIAAVSSVFVSEQYFLPFWLLGGLATALWLSRDDPPEELGGLPLAFAGAPALDVRAGDESPATNYDLEMRAQAVEERERRLSAQYASMRAQQEQMLRRRRTLDERERDVEEQLSTFAAIDADLSRRELEVGRREAEQTQQAPVLEARAAEIAASEAEQAARLSDLDRRTEELDSLARAAESARRKIAESEQTLAERTEAVWRRERDFIDAKGKAEAREREAAAVERRAARQAKQLAEQLEAIEARGQELDRKTAALADAERASAEQRKRLATEERRVERLTSQLERRAANMERREAELGGRLERLLAQEKELEARETVDEARKKSLDVAANDLQQWERRLVSGTSALQARELALERREAELGRGPAPTE